MFEYRCPILMTRRPREMTEYDMYNIVFESYKTTSNVLPYGLYPFSLQKVAFSAPLFRPRWQKLEAVEGT